MSLRVQRRRRQRSVENAKEMCGRCEGRGLVIDSGGVCRPVIEAEGARCSVAIVGGGLSGLALALGLQHRGVSCRVFERDSSLESRSQGYALTLQQGCGALRGLGVTVIGVSPERHVSVSSRTGEVLGLYERPQIKGRRSRYRAANVVAPRAVVRRALYNELAPGTVLWNREVVELERCGDDLRLLFSDGNDAVASLVVAADGAHSTCARLGGLQRPDPLGVVVALGICKASVVESSLLRGATWQAVDGEGCRLYAMPFLGGAPYASTDTDKVSDVRDDEPTTMWQLSWVGNEVPRGADAILAACAQHVEGWLADAVRLIKATPTTEIVAYAVRASTRVTPRSPRFDRLVHIGDARAAMTPFKGQGANQALIDSLLLARLLKPVFNPRAGKPVPLDAAISAFEGDCIRRVTPKVTLSTENAHILHSAAALARADISRADAARAFSAKVERSGDMPQRRSDDESQTGACFLIA